MVSSVWPMPRCYKQTVSGVSPAELSKVEWFSWWVSELVRGWLWFSPCGLLLLEAGSWSTETFQEPRVRGTSTAGSSYQLKTGKDTANWKDLVRAVVNCRVGELAIVLWLLVVTICKWSINTITSPDPIYSHMYTWHYIK
jgi:hypothetical protein